MLGAEPSPAALELGAISNLNGEIIYESLSPRGGGAKWRLVHHELLTRLQSGFEQRPHVLS